MGLLDLVGQVLSEQETGTAKPGGGFANVLTQLLSGQRQGQPGGVLTGLLDQFRQAGLGHVAESWVGTGQNHPVSPDQLRTVLGDNQVRSMSQDAGMNENDFLSQLSQHLPRAVDRATPAGEVPDEGTMSV